jgi:hypothetical protein
VLEAFQGPDEKTSSNETGTTGCATATFEVADIPILAGWVKKSGAPFASVTVFVVAAGMPLAGADPVGGGGNVEDDAIAVPKSKLSSKLESKEKAEAGCAEPPFEILPRASSKLFKPLVPDG